MRLCDKCFTKNRRATVTLLRCAWIATLTGAWLSAPDHISAQRAPFGSEGDLREQIQPDWWRRDNTLMAMGGLSLIGPQWRAATGVRLALVTRAVTLRLKGTLRLGPLGHYTPDMDEPYDLLRLVDFARINPTSTRPLHLRVGQLDGMRLGIGHIVNYYSTSVAWDERTIGAEFSYGGRGLSVSGFTGDLRLQGLSGVQLAANPFYASRTMHARTMRVSLSYVTDRATSASLDALSADLQLVLFQSSGIQFMPFASYAWYPDYGDGLAFGADIFGPGLLDLLTFQLRIGAFYNSHQFIPGYAGALYAVHNLHARIARASGDGFAGLTLAEARSANELLTEFRLEVAPTFSLRYYYRQHFGYQQLSEFHFRLFVRRRDRLQFEVGIDKLGAASFLGIFDTFDDQSALVFGADYRLLSAFYVNVVARYSFERIGGGDAPRYLVQRRFEPFAGFQIRF